MSTTLGSVLAPFAKEAPELFGRFADALVSAGFPLDLGPMTPDVKKHFATIAEEERDRLREKFEDPKPSDR